MRHECSIQHNVFSFHLIKCSSTGHCSTTGTFPKSPNLQSSDCSDCSTLVQRLSNHYRMKYYSFHTAPPSSLFTARLRVCIRDAVSGWSSVAGGGACRLGHCHQGPSCFRAHPHRHGQPRWGWWAWQCGARTCPLGITHKRRHNARLFRYGYIIRYHH